MLGTTVLATTFESSTQLTALIPSAQLVTAGAFPVTVVNPSPGGGTATPVNFAVLVVVGVTPSSPTVLASQAQQFAALVGGSTNQTVSWSVSCVAGGTACGSIDTASGLYSAPPLPPSPNTVTITAVPAADTSRSGATTASIVNPAPSIAAVTPTSVNAGSGDTPLAVHGAGFTPQSRVWLAGAELPTTFVNSGQLAAILPAALLANTGPQSLTVVTPTPGGGTSSPATVTINQAPAITSSNSAAFVVGTAGSFTITPTGYPTPALSESGTLPSGVTFNPATGILRGTAAPGTGGTYPISFTASNGVGPDFAQSFTLTINQPPAITSSNTATFAVGTAGAFTVTATGFPAPVMSVGGALPSGVTFNSSTGALSGAPGAGMGGTYNVTFTASNGVSPNATQDFALIVDKLGTTTSVVASANPSLFGQIVTLTATVIPVSGTLTAGGTVQFKVDGANLGSPAPVSACNPSPNACAVTTTSSLAVTSGPAHAVEAQFSGDGTFNASMGGGLALAVSQAGTTTTITSDLSFATVVGQPYTVKWSVSPTPPGNGTPTGMVTVTGDGTCSAAVSLGQCDLTSSAAGSKTLTASYSGDVNFSTSTSAGASHAVNKSGTTTTITTDLSTATVVGQSYPVAWTVIATSPGSGTPTGSVTVSDGLANCSAAAAAGQCSLTSTSSGAKSIAATYAGDSNYGISTSVGKTHTVNKAETTTAITAHTPNPSIVGQPFTVNFRVSVNAPGSGAATGNVTVSDGTESCVGTVAAGTCQFTPTTSGNKVLTATYSSDVNFAASTSGGVSHTSGQPPAITSAISATFTVGAAGSFTVTATGFPAPALSKAGTLPPGVSLTDNGNGTAMLSGTPAAGTGGPYPVSITASNGVGANATQNFTLTVNQPPTITSPNSASFTVGAPGSFTVAAAGYPTPALSESGALPGGVTFDTTTGLLTGTPAAGTGRTYSITFTASNGVAPNASQTFTLTVGQPPSFTSPDSVAFTEATAGAFPVVATGFPTPTLSQSGTLPSGVTFNVGTGILSGTPEASTGGTYSLTFTASNGVGSDAVQNFTLTVNQPPAITSADSVTFTVETAGSFTVTTTGVPTPTLSDSGTLPSGVTFVDGTGVLSGTPDAAAGGNYSLTFTASNGVAAPAIQNFTLVVNNPVPAVTSISPNVVNYGSSATTLTVTGTGFIPGSTVNVGATSLAPTSVTSTQLTVLVSAGQLASPALLPVTVTNLNPGGGTSSPAMNLEVRRVNITPSAPTLAVNQTRQFTAEVYGAPSQAVTWWVNGIEGGDSTSGTISVDGLYIAPGAVPAPSAVIVKAVNAADELQFGAATVTVTLPVSDNYPRLDATSVLRTPGTLQQVPHTGWKVAVLDWTTREDAYGTQEDLLAVCHVLSPLGIPHDHVTSVPDPAAYPFLAVAGVLDQNYASSPTALTITERDALASYVQNGGTLFLWLPSDTGVLSRLNLSVTDTHTDVPNTFRRPLTFDPTTLDHALTYVDFDVTGAAFEEAEVHWNMLYPGGVIPTFGYGLAGAGEELATWDAGGAAVVRSELGGGRAYVFGWRLRHNLTDGENGAAPDDSLGPLWTNTPRLGADICRLLVRGAYEGWAGTNAQVRLFAPDGKKAALILTHDIDDPTSYELTPTIAGLEADWGVKATYNFTTNPYDSGAKETFYDAYGMQQIQQALDLGMDVESHGIGHFPDFNLAPLTLGSKTETAANYFPHYSNDLGQTIGMSVLGEVGVSRWLLENDFAVVVEGHRSGFLLVPPDLFQGLKETGYRRDSSRAAGVTRGSFPFVAFKVSAPGGDVTTYPIVEYPIAISDDQPGLQFNSTNYNQYLNEWKSVIRANYANNAPTVLLIHPVAAAGDADGSLRQQAEQEIIDWATTTYPDIWVGDWKTFAEFWEAQGVTCSQWP